MTKTAIGSILAMALLALCLEGAPASAQLSRTFVSAAIGSDANNCDRPTPCRTFQGAHDKTNPNGEITVLDPGGYGAVTITKSLSIVNEGVGDAGILVSAGGIGVIVNAGQADYVNLRGITVQGIGFGRSFGLLFINGFALTISNCVIRNNVGDGLVLQPATDSHVSISETLIADNGGTGIVIEPGPSQPGIYKFDLNEVEAYHNSVDGLLVDTQFANQTLNVSVTDSVFANNGRSGLTTVNGADSAQGTSAIITRSVFANNGSGFFITSSNSIPVIPVLVGGSIVAGNSGGAIVGLGSIFTFRDNYSVGNNRSDGLGTGMLLK